MSSSDDGVLFEELHADSKLIFAFLSSRNIGDFTEQLIVASSVKESLEGYRLAVFYIKDRDYTDKILTLCPSVDIALVGPHGMAFLINIFDVYSGRMAFQDAKIEGNHLYKSAIILSGSGISQNCLPGFEYVPRLRFPNAERARQDEALIDIGLDPERWFACVYWREPGYQERTSHPLRDILNPAPYLAAIDHIVDMLGGQVVRLGHPTQTKLRSHPDIIDIAKREDSLMTQAAAIARARFFISSPSGPLTFGPGFGTPTAVTDNIDISGVWNSHDLLLTQEIIAPDGCRFSGRSAYDAKLLSPGRAVELIKPEQGYRYVKNSKEQLIDIADRLYRRTEDCPAWQSNDDTIRGRRGGASVSLPLRPAVRASAFV
jgi:putative glycosyltransferase (TIGR04372 family)